LRRGIGSVDLLKLSQTPFPSLVRRGICAEGADGGGLFKVPRSGSLQISARSALLLLCGVQPDLEWCVHREADFQSTRQDIGKDGMAEPIKPKSDTYRRYHSSGNTGRQAKPGVR